MKASGIGLQYYRMPKGGAKAEEREGMVIHLHDSPGHVDFSAEVASSLLLSDTALLIIDAVEGPCARTHSLLREAHSHEMVPILVINKVDRLICDLGLTPEEAYVRIRELVESVNAAAASMVNTAALDNDDGEKKIENDTQHGAEIPEESVWNFDPVKGNVVFTSAIHGWGFTVPTLARSLFKTKTIPIKPPMLRQYLFGDYKYKHETGKVLKWKPNQGEPMFAEFALRPIWEVYGNISMGACSVGLKSDIFTDGRYNYAAPNDKHKEGKITATTDGIDQVLLSIQAGSTAPSMFVASQNDNDKVPSNSQEMQQLMSRTGASSEISVLSTILRRYRPLSDAVLEAACDIGPSPADASTNYRKRALALRAPQSLPDSLFKEYNKIQEAVRNCETSGSVPTVAHVCKFASVPRASVTDSGLPPVSVDADAGSSNMIMGIARVLSGTLCTEDIEYYTFGPRYDWNGQGVHKQRIRCYLLMGSSFVKVDKVPAGHICAIYNLEMLQLKTVTLCDKMECMPLRGFAFGLQPLVKVNVEPELASGELWSLAHLIFNSSLMWLKVLFGTKKLIHWKKAY